MEIEGEGYSPVKDRHIEICLHGAVESGESNGLESVELSAGFPDFSMSEMDTGAEFLGRRLALPLLIAPLTGGGRSSERINKNLATAAERLGIAMALGSERPFLEGRVPPDSYLVRESAPTIPLLANLGLVHVREGSDYLRKAVESVQADGIILYANPLHEILQEQPERDFGGTLERLGEVLAGFPYPVLLKEVGFGFPASLLNWSGSRKIRGVDVAGLGGTNWARIEGLAQGRDYGVYERLGSKTRDVILSAGQCLREDQYLIASGGIRTGVDMAKAFALGACMVSMGLPFLRWANESVEAVIRGVEQLKRELTVAMWYSGAKNIAALKGKTAVSGYR